MIPHPDRSRAAITAIEYYLPDEVLTSERLASEYPDWPVAKIVAKTGIRERHIAAPHECASDLAVRAARKLFDSGAVRPGDIDMLLLCTQTPDYFLPTTACIVQDRLGISTEAGALDINLGCSGFVYGLGIAKGLIETGQADTILLVTADTYSKFIRESDRSVRTLFGDGAAATLIETLPLASGPHIEAPVWGTDGRGACNLIVKGGAAKSWSDPGSCWPGEGIFGAHPAGTRPNGTGPNGTHPVGTHPVGTHPAGTHPAGTHCLEMNGPEIFNFTVGVVPTLVENVLQRTCKTMGDIDLFVFHQANKTLLSHLREKIGIPQEKFYLALEDCGNTVSSTIPIALKRARLEGALRPGQLALLAGFGVGYSWAGTVVRWPSDRRFVRPDFPGPQ